MERLERISVDTPSGSPGVPSSREASAKEWPPNTYLGAITDEARKALLSLGRRRVFSDGQVFITVGDQSTDVYVILQGMARVESLDVEGRLQVVDFQVLGDTVGVAAAIRHMPRSATVKATGSFVAIEIPGDVFIQFLLDNPLAHLALTRMMLARADRRKNYRLDANQYDALTIVARTLVDLAESYGTATDEGVGLDAIISQTDLAPLSGWSESAVNKALHTLRNEGAIGRGRLRLTIIDMDVLFRLGQIPI
ncbi:Crp/Fnr family transcriptional regulator [Streptosporangiaceae bacterium NEAU-GS5]|nr:Crp/Fnr family transcriptional regulator [Streptosporangiaceae bacterium NEAU-GS5]